MKVGIKLTHEQLCYLANTGLHLTADAQYRLNNPRYGEVNLHPVWVIEYDSVSLLYLHNYPMVPDTVVHSLILIPTVEARLIFLEDYLTNGEYVYQGEFYGSRATD